MYVISDTKLFWCLLKEKVQTPLLRYSRHFVRWLPSWILHLLIFPPPYCLSFRREGSLKVSKKPSTRRLLMKNGKASHGGIKAEMVVSSTGDPWLLECTDGLTAPGSLFPLLFILCRKRMEMRAWCWSHAFLSGRIIACIMPESIQWV